MSLCAFHLLTYLLAWQQKKHGGKNNLGTVSELEPSANTRADQNVDKHELPFVLDVDGAAVSV